MKKIRITKLQITSIIIAIAAAIMIPITGAIFLLALLIMFIGLINLIIYFVNKC